MTDPEGTTQSQGVDLLASGEARPETALSSHAFRAIYEAEFSYVWHTLRRLGVRDRDLEDLTHDLFVTVYRRIEDYDVDRPVRPWLFGFAFRLASDYRRLARHQREVVDSDLEGMDPVPLADQQMAAEQRRRVVQAALDTLELDRRAVFVMHDLDGCAMPEIARALSIPLNTAYSRLRLAREQFTAAVRRIRAQAGAA
ncbi:MAG: sigma-70 family RNA polymerase sigma factor [Deltaproteobacteria bacterium]|nr:sigma-70 family RNA polymerase sigma factor [Deltaproteobacteria bacterium]